MNALDIIFGITILIFLLSGLIKGFVDEIFSKLSPMMGLFFGMVGMKYMEAYTSQVVKIPFLSKALSFIMVFIVAFLLGEVIRLLLKKVFSMSLMQGLNKALGLIFGLGEGIIVVTFILCVLSNLNIYELDEIFNIKELLSTSLFYEYLKPLVEYLTRQVESVKVNV